MDDAGWRRWWRGGNRWCRHRRLDQEPHRAPPLEMAVTLGANVPASAAVDVLASLDGTRGPTLCVPVARRCGSRPRAHDPLRAPRNGDGPLWWDRRMMSCRGSLAATTGPDPPEARWRRVRSDHRAG